MKILRRNLINNKSFYSEALLAFLVLFFIKDCSAAGNCRPDTPYYFSEFNPASWRVENELNYEEVYKNFEYFEVSFNKSCDEITVKRYKKGQLDSSEKFKLNSDGTIQKTGDKE